MATTTQIAVERRGAVLRLLHDRPEMRNAESQTLLDELDAALREAIADETVRVIVIGGRGDHFSAGHDLKEAAARRAGFGVEERWAYEELRYLDYALRIWDCPKPTIAEVKGACIAGGFMVANMCDLIVASDDAFFADPVCRTLAAAAVEVLVHPWVMGLRAAKEFLFTGRRLGAEEAHRIGMVNRVVPRAELEAATMALAQGIAEAPPFALRLTKRSLNRTLDIQGFRAAIAAHFDTHQLSHMTDEFRRTREAGLAGAIARGKAATTGAR
ncbi:enoyl-CoA hydratase [Caldovatus sediminis]|uniref:Enoyl-CoA hydratase n=1 Tax=Caldovatus sediminis TaxID=2041189 RepID=A0A8J2ZDV0_9PROT|nr:enoyl-CoA hydratase [Caldovatus sediminis]GGG44560.1 enoyl-CoA hydratase [Caldovatus sediminis]